MSGTPLTAIGALASVALRIFALYVVTYLLVRLNHRARTRHALWMIFVIVAAFCWLVTLAATAQHPTSRSESTGMPRALTSDTTAHSPMKLTIPHEWTARVGPIAEAGFVLYGVGLTFMIGRLYWRRRQLRTVLWHACAVGESLQTRFDEECALLGIENCELVELPGLRSPGTAYTRRPVVMIPDGLASYLDEEQFVDVLYHELMHVERRDFFWNTIAEISACMLWWHPAMWLGIRRLARERELACDMAVVTLRQGRESEYALCLTRLERRRAANLHLEPVNHLALLNSFLALRIKTLLTDAPERRPWIRTAALGASAAIVLGAAVVWTSLALGFDIESMPAAATGAARTEPHPESKPVSALRRSIQAASELGEAALPGPQLSSNESSAVTATDASMRQRSPVDPSLDGVDGVTPGGDGLMARPRRLGQSSDGDESGSSSANHPDWKQTATDAAVGALGHLAAGHRDGDDDADDRSVKPF